MNNQISYKDILMKNSNLQFEVSKKNVENEYLVKDIKKIYIYGNLDELKKVPLKYLSNESKLYFINIMKEKIVEIEIWKTEDKNKIEELDTRINNINKCILHLETIK